MVNFPRDINKIYRCKDTFKNLMTVRNILKLVKANGYRIGFSGKIETYLLIGCVPN